MSAVLAPERENPSAGPSFSRIMEAVAAEFEVTLEELRSSRRSKPIARPRQIVMYLARHLTELSLPQIGWRLGRRDHTTIIHGVRKITERMTFDGHLARDIQRLMATLASAGIPGAQA